VIYRCECLDPTCRERLALGEKEYDRLARLGAVVSPWCAERERRHKLASVRSIAVAVPTSKNVRDLVPLLRGRKR
jgi:hypothetical protein